MSNQAQIADRLLAPTMLIISLLAVAFGVACGGSGDDAAEATATAEDIATAVEPTLHHHVDASARTACKVNQAD